MQKPNYRGVAFTEVALCGKSWANEQQDFFSFPLDVGGVFLFGANLYVRDVTMTTAKRRKGRRLATKVVAVLQQATVWQ